MLAFTSVYFSGISLFNRLRPFGVKKILSPLRPGANVSDALPVQAPSAARPSTGSLVRPRRRYNTAFGFCQGIVKKISQRPCDPPMDSLGQSPRTDVRRRLRPAVASTSGTAPSRGAVRRPSSDGHIDHLQLGEFRQALFAQLSANSRILGPAERYVGQNVEVLVDPNRARLHLRGQVVSRLLVGRPD